MLDNVSTNASKFNENPTTIDFVRFFFNYTPNQISNSESIGFCFFCAFFIISHSTFSFFVFYTIQTNPTEISEHPSSAQCSVECQLKITVIENKTKLRWDVLVVVIRSRKKYCSSSNISVRVRVGLTLDFGIKNLESVFAFGVENKLLPKKLQKLTYRCFQLKKASKAFESSQKQKATIF